MLRIIPTLLFLAVVCLCVPTAAQTEASPRTAETVDTAHIIAEFTAGEDEFLAALRKYGYRTDIVVQSVRNGKATGEYRRSTRIVLKDGKPQTAVIDAPRPSLTELSVTPDDIAGLSAEYQYLLGTANAGKYDIAYNGKETVQSLDLYLFDVKPKTANNKELLFSGRVWVSVANLRIVKLRRDAMKKGNQRFPVTEYYRKVIDGRYLFPYQTIAEDTLTFSSGQSANVRTLAEYSEFARLP
jgi:outer membrane lipoprotein-sorting protein